MFWHKYTAKLHDINSYLFISSSLHAIALGKGKTSVVGFLYIICNAHIILTMTCLPVEPFVNFLLTIILPISQLDCIVRRSTFNLLTLRSIFA